MSKTIEEIRAKRLLKDYIESKNNQIKELQEQNSELVNVIKDLIPMAEDGYKLHKNNGSHQDFLEDDREILKKAKELLTKYNHLKSNTNVETHTRDGGQEG